MPNKNRPERSDRLKPLSMHPLPMDEALADAMQVPPPDHDPEPDDEDEDEDPDHKGKQPPDKGRP